MRSSQSKDKLNVLISAYACSPDLGSEAGVGWGFVSELAKFHNIYVITQFEKFQPAIDTAIKKAPHLASIKFFGINRSRNMILERIWPPSYYWSYRAWQKDAYKLALALSKDIKFDVIHQLNMVGFREPGYLWKIGIPFVWGPIGGMGYFPWRFLHLVGAYGALYYTGYNLFNALQMRFLRRPKLAAISAGRGLIAATPENQAGAKRYWNRPSTLICEVGLPPAPLQRPMHRHAGEPMRLVWTGQHTPGKALNLALTALARVPEGSPWELHVLGKGPRTSIWKGMAQHFGLTERCNFHGWLPRDEALKIMANCHVMLITSLRDLTSTVTIEALAMGLPIICLDHCGFSSVVDDTCGIKVPVSTPEEAVDSLAAGIFQLIDNESMRFDLAQGAVVRAKEFSWGEKTQTLSRIYRRVIDEHQKVSE